MAADRRNNDNDPRTIRQGKDQANQATLGKVSQLQHYPDCN